MDSCANRKPTHSQYLVSQFCFRPILHRLVTTQKAAHDNKQVETSGKKIINYDKVPPRFELGLLDSESRVLTVTPRNHTVSNNEIRLVQKGYAAKRPVRIYVKIINIIILTNTLRQKRHRDPERQMLIYLVFTFLQIKFLEISC